MQIITGTIDDLSNAADILSLELPTFDEHPLAEDIRHRLPEPTAVPLPRSCPWCKSTDMWLTASKYPQWRCRRCHPPVDGAEQITAKPQQVAQDAPHGPNDAQGIVTLAPFVCRACGSTSWRQGIVARICADCQVPGQAQL